MRSKITIHVPERHRKHACTIQMPIAYKNHLLEGIMNFEDIFECIASHLLYISFLRSNSYTVWYVLKFVTSYYNII